MSKKRIALLMAVVMVLGVAVGSTMAWLTDKTGDVVNTFTVGDINIDLKEHEYISETDAATNESLKDKVGTLGTTEVTSNDDYLFVPGDTIPKDPFVTVNAGSEKCYLFVKIVENNNMIKDVADVPNHEADIIEWTVEPKKVGETAADTGWEKLSENDAKTEQVWYRIVEKNDAKQQWNILKGNNISVSDDVTKEMVTYLKANQPKLTFTAYAVQYDNISEETNELARAQAAWTIANS